MAREEADAVRAVLSQLSAAKDGTDHRAIRTRMADLEQAAKHLNVVMLDDSLTKGLEGKKISEVS